MLKIAHRGGPGNGPEHTIEAFDKSIKQCVDMVECDVRLCGSGELVLMHDRDIERTTNGEGHVSRMKLKKLKKYKTTDGKKILTLDEFIERYKGKTKIMIDVKSIGAAPRLVEIIKKHKIHNDVIVASTLHPLLIDVVMRDPEIRTSVSFDIYSYFKYLFVKRLFILPAKLTGSDTVNIYHHFVKKEMVDLAHKYRLKINVFVVNEKTEIEYFRSLGVDGIITNYPELL